MTDPEREILRRDLLDRLTVLWGRTQAEVEALVARDATPPDTGDDSDEAVDDEDYSVAADLDERGLEQAHAIEDALRAMRHGDYGRCVDCGREIPFERLRALPWAARCAEDQERLEQQAGTHAPTL